jgi:hypothetical protein
MSATGFAGGEVQRRHVYRERELAELLSAMRFRERNSQSLSLSDAAYAAGLRRIEHDLDDPQTPKMRATPSMFCHGARRSALERAIRAKNDRFLRLAGIVGAAGRMSQMRQFLFAKLRSNC